MLKYLFHFVHYMKQSKQLFSKVCKASSKLSRKFWTRRHDTVRGFKPIFMKFTRLVRVYPCMNSIVFGNNRPNRTTDIGKKCHQNRFFGFHSASMGFLRKTLKNSIWYHISHRKDYINFYRSTPLFLPSKNYFSWLF